MCESPRFISKFFFVVRPAILLIRSFFFADAHAGFQSLRAHMQIFFATAPARLFDATQLSMLPTMAALQ